MGTTEPARLQERLEAALGPAWGIGREVRLAPGLQHPHVVHTLTKVGTALGTLRTWRPSRSRAPPRWTAAPRLGHKVQSLRNEHPEMQDATSALKARLTSTSVGDALPVAEARDEIQRVLGRLVKHRQLGADLLWEAYTLDVGGSD